MRNFNEKKPELEASQIPAQIALEQSALTVLTRKCKEWAQVGYTANLWKRDGLNLF
jgi:hypothetical protein